MDAGVMIGFIQRMGFVMAKFAALKDRKEMLKLNDKLNKIKKRAK